MQNPTYQVHQPAPEAEALRLEGITVSVGFDDFLDVTLSANHPHLDTMIVVTSQDDLQTQKVARKHGCLLVMTDLFGKNGRNFNKGAAICEGMSRFQYRGWRLHLDSDVMLPDNFRRLLFNHTALERDCIYGADRVNIIGRGELEALQRRLTREPQNAWSFMVNSKTTKPIESRYVDTLRGYIPLGYFQLWHASAQRDYPYSLGTAAHDDVAFASQWPAVKRRLLPSVIVYHLLARKGKMGENWDGHRAQPRFI